MNKHLAKAILITVFLLPAVSVASTLTVDIFTTHQFPVIKKAEMQPLPTDARLHIYYLDQAGSINASINNKLDHYYRLYGRRHLKQYAIQLIHGYQSGYHKRIHELQAVIQDHVTRIPEVVINHHYQIWGTTDPNEAYQVYYNNVLARERQQRNLDAFNNEQ